MPFRLVVEFGGLCLFVTRFDKVTQKDVLSVLLPSNEMSDDAHAEQDASDVMTEHIPRIAMKVIDGYDSRQISNTPLRVDWRRLRTSAIPRKPLPVQLLPLTALLGDARVSAECLDEQTLPKSVAVRFDFPIPRLLFPVGEDACVEAVVNGTSRIVQTVGRICGVWDTEDAVLGVPEFGTVGPTTDGWLELFVRNTPVPDVIGENPPPVGSPLSHQRHYLQLLTPKGIQADFNVGCSKLIYEDQDDPMNMADGADAASTDGFSPMSVNPFQCTLAGGCAEADDECQQGVVEI